MTLGRDGLEGSRGDEPFETMDAVDKDTGTTSENLRIFFDEESFTKARWEAPFAYVLGPWMNRETVKKDAAKILDQIGRLAISPRDKKVLEGEFKQWMCETFALDPSVWKRASSFDQAVDDVALAYNRFVNPAPKELNGGSDATKDIDGGD